MVFVFFLPQLFNVPVSVADDVQSNQLDDVVSIYVVNSFDGVETNGPNCRWVLSWNFQLITWLSYALKIQVKKSFISRKNEKLEQKCEIEFEICVSWFFVILPRPVLLLPRFSLKLLLPTRTRHPLPMRGIVKKHVIKMIFDV